MKPKELFGVATRVFGLYLIWHGFDQCAYYFNLTHGYSRLGSPVPDSLLTHVVVDLILGGCFLIGAPLILAVAYPTRPEAGKAEPIGTQGTPPTSA